jgi:signal transduction histidine kinase
VVVRHDLMDTQSESAVKSHQNQKISPLTIYTACISGLGVALLFWSLTRLPSSWPQVLPFIALVTIAELTTSGTFAPQMVFSMSSAVGFATLVLFGPLPATLTAMVGSIVETLMAEIEDKQRDRSRAPFLQRLLFNMAALGLPVVLAGVVYVLLGGRIGEVTLLGNLLPMILAALVVEFANAALVVGAVSLQTDQPLLKVWRQNVSWAVPMNILGMIVGGGGLALGYDIAGILGLVVFFLPILLNIYAFRLYVARTKAQMQHLEEIIAERTADLQKANKELRQLDRLKTSFFAVINHEMRNPLTAIIGYTDLMLRDSQLTSDQLRKLGYIKDNSQRLLDLANNLLDITRIEEEKTQIRPGILDVMAAVDRALVVVSPLADQKHISFFADVPVATRRVYADPRRVDQILVNLLSNAIKYTPDTGSVLVMARASEDGNMVRISVADNGYGVPPKLLDFVFDRLVRAEYSERSGTMGTGLGLTIAKGLVEAQGGEIWVDSVERYGTVFTFTLPGAAQVLEEASPPLLTDTGQGGD